MKPISKIQNAVGIPVWKKDAKGNVMYYNSAYQKSFLPPNMKNYRRDNDNWTEEETRKHHARDKAAWQTGFYDNHCIVRGEIMRVVKVRIKDFVWGMAIPPGVPLSTEAKRLLRILCLRKLQYRNRELFNTLSKLA